MKAYALQTLLPYAVAGKFFHGVGINPVVNPSTVVKAPLPQLSATDLPQSFDWRDETDAHINFASTSRNQHIPNCA